MCHGQVERKQLFSDQLNDTHTLSLSLSLSHTRSSPVICGRNLRDRGAIINSIIILLTFRKTASTSTKSEIFLNKKVHSRGSNAKTSRTWRRKPSTGETLQCRAIRIWKLSNITQTTFLYLHRIPSLHRCRVVKIW